jgi:uncharacterized RDD family membrane protein YckC
MLDDELIIETPERVELHYVLASIGNRFLAAGIDHLIQGLAVFALALLLTWLGRGLAFFSQAGAWTAALTVLGAFTIYWGYFAAFETIWSGQTPGKRIMKLRVIREDGRPVRFFEVFVRNILRLFIDFMPLPSYAIGVVSIIFSSRSKRVGDFVAGTVVVKERSTEAPTLDEIVKVAELEQERLERAAPLTLRADTRLLTAQEIRAVQTFLKRRYELPEPNRSTLSARIAASVAGRLGIEPGQQAPEALLEEVERQHQVQTKYFD